MASDFLPYGRQSIGADDLAAVMRVLSSDYLTTGPEVSLFERALAARIGVKHAVVCANGTAALHLAMLALGIGPGHKVIVPTLTFVATANAVRMVGAQVIFADVDPENGLMGAAQFAKALKRAGEGVRAVIPVHLNGQTADLAAIRTIANANKVQVVSDACHALGSTYADGSGEVGDGRFEELACFSFHPVKAMAMGEGGAVTTNDPSLARALHQFRDHGLVRDAERFTPGGEGFDQDGEIQPWILELQALGFNYRASDLHCALGRSQLAKVDQFISRRRQLMVRYDALFEDFSPWLKPVSRVRFSNPAWHLNAVLIDFAGLQVKRASVMKALRARGIGSQVHYAPVHRQPLYRAHDASLLLPGADAYYARQLSLPLYPALSDEDQDRVVAGLAEVLGLEGQTKRMASVR